MNIYLKLTERCNLRCLHCYNPPISQDINYDKLTRFLDAICKYVPDPYFILHGGEPMMADIKAIDKLINKFHLYRWRISTNLCYKITEEKLNILKKMEQIRISFDIGIRFASFSNLLIWLNNVKLLKKECPNKLFCNICLSKQLIKHNPRHILSMLQHLGIKRFGLERLTLRGNILNNQDIIPTYEDIDMWLCELYAANKDFPEISCTAIDTIRLGIHGEFNHCYGKECCCQTLTVNADGTIGNCPNDARDNIMGSIDSNINDVLSNIICAKHHIKDKCLSCDYYKQCHGWCEQMDWQGDTCPYPFKLSQLIKNEHTS